MTVGYVDVLKTPRYLIGALLLLLLGSAVVRQIFSDYPQHCLHTSISVCAP